MKLCDAGWHAWVYTSIRKGTDEALLACLLLANLGKGASDKGAGAVPEGEEVVAVPGGVKLLALGDVKDVADDAVGKVGIGWVARGLFVGGGQVRRKMTNRHAATARSTLSAHLNNNGFLSGSASYAALACVYVRVKYD